MNNYLSWLSMGKYALYVWPAYGLVIALLFGNLFTTKWQSKRVKLKVKRWLKRQDV